MVNLQILYNVPVSSDTTSAALITFGDGLLDGTLSTPTILTSSGGSKTIAVNVTESPTLLLLNGVNFAALPRSVKMPVTAFRLNGTGTGNLTVLIDEQGGDPAMGQGGSPITQWNPGYAANTYPASVRFDYVVGPQAVTQVWVYDANNVGTLIVEYLSDIDYSWHVLATDPMTLYNAWKVFVMPRNAADTAPILSHSIRFTMVDGGACFNEVMLYYLV
jgi:hypothetical protein